MNPQDSPGLRCHVSLRGTQSTLSLFAVIACAASSAHAEFEEVRITRTEPMQVQQACPPGLQAPAATPQAPPPQPGGLGVTGKEVLGTAAGAAVGGVLGHQVGRGSGQTAATVAGAAVGGFAGYKLTEDKPKAPPQAQASQQGQLICLTTQYRVFYARPSGLQGDVMMSSAPTSSALMINFCGDKPCN
jgi:hypothetical protein